MCDKDGKNIKITDFGFVMIDDQAYKTAIRGDTNYHGPEVARKEY